MLPKAAQKEQRRPKLDTVTKALVCLGKEIIKAMKAFWLWLKLLYIELRYQLNPSSSQG
jgi:hypothetical protein